MPTKNEITTKQKIVITRDEVLRDYETGWISRHMSLVGRREVLTGKAKFGIFGDGKELPQLVMAKCFREGDFRSGYYRDQTFMFATGMLTVRAFFAQLYANVEPGADSATGGRMMNGHFATRLLDEKGSWLPLATLKNSSADISPTAGQMPRLLGLAYASKLYRNLPELAAMSKPFSRNGAEVAFGTIGNASTSEGHFFEVLNAAGVLRVPMAISVWDDGYGISVPAELQTTKSSISAAMSGMDADSEGRGVRILSARGWDYESLHDLYLPAIERMRHDHIPALFHIQELTQPQGHSTSGSHERYKTPERLQWEKEFDCLTQMRLWMVRETIATEEELSAIEKRAQQFVETERKAAFAETLAAITAERDAAHEILRICDTPGKCPAPTLEALRTSIKNPLGLSRKLVQANLTRAAIALRECSCATGHQIREATLAYRRTNNERYSSYLFSDSAESPFRARPIAPVYPEQPEMVDGRHILQRCFETHFARDPSIFVIGEDVGRLGDVNLVFEGLQDRFGPLRLTDTGIREASIAGQGIGAALRGLRPIVDIQYLDYLLYALQTLSDDLATLHYRTAGGQKAPVVIRTKGHRLEGVWHSGSPLGLVVNALRGVHVLVPRDMTTAAGFYNLALRSDHPTLIIETLNAYRLKESMPSNVGDFIIPFGVPETLRVGSHVTLVTYGACCRIALEAAELLSEMSIDVEVIDVRSLSPFDIHHHIARSVTKTGALVVVDEDGPAGASAYMLQQILEEQNGYDLLDARPRTLTAKPHRPAYGSDGDYFSKPNIEEIVEQVYATMNERSPERFPSIFR
jgi:pyruvate/2-oxoglutarate/acetoin dehydrogenase E1 component/TPP-dependent pyruvate/acetoin dehydrogenase alpha subunit